MISATTTDLITAVEPPDLGGLPGVRAACLACGPGLFWRRDRPRFAELVREHLGAPPDTPVVFGEQTHGSAVALVPPVSALRPPPTSTHPGVDALATALPGVILVVRTADCVPVLLASSESPWVAAVHAGWRGTLGRIVEKTIDSAAQSDIRPESMRMWIGPRIGAEVYEVSEDLAESFARTFGPLGYQPRGRRLDLGRINELQALGRGVAPGAIRSSASCTFSSKGLLPSYRRDGVCRGQIYTAIMLTD